MSIIPVLCVVLLFSQVEMLPVNSVQHVGIPEELISKAAPENQVVDSATGGVLSRIRRAALAGSFINRCSNGMTELWKGGPCVTCEKYMDMKDTDDCPGTF